MKQKHYGLLFALLPLLVFMGFQNGRSQDQSEPSLVNLSFEIPRKVVQPGQTIEIPVTMDIQDGWHINAHKPLDEFLIPTTFEFETSSGYTIQQMIYPPAQLEKFAFSETKLAVYTHRVVAKVKLQISPKASSGPLNIKGKLRYQACNENSCLPPVSRPFSFTLSVGSALGKSPLQSSVVTPKLNLSPIPGNVAPVSQGGTPGQVVTPQLLFSLSKAYPGSDLKAAVVLKIQPGWHINSDKPRDEFLIPTKIQFDAPSGVQIKKIIFPPALVKKFDFSEDSMAVYEGQALVGVILGLDKNLNQKALTISGTLTYQACNDVSCMPPKTVPFSGEIELATRQEAVSLIHSDIFDQINFGVEKTAVAGNEISGMIAEKGLALSLIFIFLGGLALNLTPCVYPIIPITVSYFGGQASGNIAKMFSLSLVYVLGIAVTYSILGVVAALSGSLFGSMLQNPVVLIFVALVMVTLALSMFGVWEITIPQSLNQMAGGARRGYLGALFMGLTVGIVAAPCIGPFVLALLTYVGTTGDPVLGFWLFFVLSMGLGLPYLILGTFSGSLRKLPQSGVWMLWVKKIFGFVLLGMAAYFLQPILPDVLARFLLPAILAIGGLVVGFLDRSKFPSKYFPVIKKGFGLLFLAAAVWLAWPEQEAQAGNWKPYSKQLVQEAKSQHIPVIIDFTAEWCVACRELEKNTFPSKPFQARAGKFLLLRADLTKFASPPVEALKKEFQIKGLPMVVFLDQNGVERRDLRVVGFIPGEEFAKRMDAVLYATN